MPKRGEAVEEQAAGLPFLANVARSVPPSAKTGSGAGGAFDRGDEGTSGACGAKTYES